jgi:peroxiredoxin
LWSCLGTNIDHPILGGFESKRKFGSLAEQCRNLLSNAIFSIFNKMNRPKTKLTSICVVALLVAASAVAQTQTNSGSPKEIFRDADGNLISNNEFVDLRLANSAEKDPATRTVLEDGTIEFRVAKPRQEGTLAPTFEAPDVDAQWINTAELKGKVLVLNFWFIGCVGCMDEIPRLSALAEKYRGNGDIMFISIATNTPQQLRAFRDREKFKYRLIGQGQALMNLFNFSGFPKNLVIGRDGKIIYWRSTIHAWDKFESVIKAELDKS